jgi:hypothetical protein
MSKNIYISRRSQPCHELLIKIHQNKHLFNFNIIDIDTNPYPNIIKSVPCLITSNNEIMPGNELFKYIDHMININKNQKQNNNNNKFVNPKSNISNKEETLGNNDSNELDVFGYCIDGVCELGFSMLEDGDNMINDNYEYLNELENTTKDIKTDTKEQRLQELDNNYDQMMKDRGFN